MLVVAGLCGLAQAQGAERHALLIGIGSYKIKPLDGPPNDVASLRALLLGKFGYNPRFVHTVIDQQATKKGILQAMEALVTEVQPGDYVFFYYSGHGTSYYDTHSRLKEAVAEDSGASLPVDFDTSSLQAFGRSVLLGRELRPFFSALDEKAQVFAVYDSCYSQDAMKALPLGTTKYVPLSQAIEGASKGDLDDAEQIAEKAPANDSNAPLPYHHLIAISAAKRDQAAVDISKENVSRNPNLTVDGQAHGQLTNAILKGLRGAADKNHDGVVSHEELFNYVNEVSAGNWRHNPKLRVSADSAAPLRQPAFASKQVVADTACQHEAPRRPRISAPADVLSELGSGFTPVTDNFDIKAVAQGSQFLLYDAGGIQMNNAPMPRKETLARLRAEPLLEQLSELRYCRQKFNIQLDSEPQDRGRYLRGQNIQFYATLDRDAYLLVIDIDQEGGVTVVYPDPGKAVDKLRSGTKVFLTKTDVSEPFGVDLIKAFAFETKPAGFDAFAAKAGSPAVWLHPGDEKLNLLLKMLATDAPDRSETRLQLTTSSD